MVIDKINMVDKMVQYLKFKGWIETPPLYNSVPQDVDEKVTTVEIYNMFDHLAFRYDNIATSELMRNFAFDGDFKMLLERGIGVLGKQVKILEKELARFGAPLPKRPGQASMVPSSTEIMHDDHMFRTVIMGLQGATILHVQPIKECTFNDRIRGIFWKLLVEELNLINDFFKYGKAKGWLHEAPMYQQK